MNVWMVGDIRGKPADGWRLEGEKKDSLNSLVTYEKTCGGEKKVALLNGSLEHVQ